MRARIGGVAPALPGCGRALPASAPCAGALAIVKVSGSPSGSEPASVSGTGVSSDVEAEAAVATGGSFSSSTRPTRSQR